MLGHATYLAFLLPWAGAVVLLQWLAGGPELRARFPRTTLVTLLATVYLSAADRFALGNGIWEISPSRSTGIRIVGLPLEEGLFFLLTNLMVSQSVALLLAPELTPRVVLERLRAHGRWLSGLARRFAVHWPVGAAAASLSALAGSALAAALGAPAALDAPWQLIMVWTPAPVAAWLVDTLGDLSRPLGLIGAFALYLFVAGSAATLARLGVWWLVVALGLSVPLSIWLGASTHPLAAAVLTLGPLLPGITRVGGIRREASPRPTSDEHPTVAAGAADSPSPQPSPMGRGSRPSPPVPFPSGKGEQEDDRRPFAVVPPSRAGKGDRGLGPSFLIRSEKWARESGPPSSPNPPNPFPESVDSSLTRRRLITRLMPLVAAAGLGVVWLVERRVRGARAERAGSPLFSPPDVAPRAAGFPVAGQPPEVTPTAEHYVVSKNVEDPAPLLDVWRLSVKGRVERELSLDLAALTERSRADQYTTLRCVSNPVGWPLMSNGLWSGVPLAAILGEAGALADARWVVARGLDGHHEDLPLAVALAPDTLVAYALNGDHLDRRHGFPARLVVPGRYGFKNVKWLESFEVVADDRPGFWPSRGWTREGKMLTAARIDLVRREGDRLLVAGVALAGTRGIRRVEVRAVEAGVAGDWLPAALHLPSLGRAAWVQWRAEIPAPARGQVQARAVDGEGRPQEETPSGPYPDGATGLDSAEVPT